MSTIFIIGFIIFILYIFSLLYMINKAHESQKKDILNDPEIPKEFKE